MSSEMFDRLLTHAHNQIEDWDEWGNVRHLLSQMVENPVVSAISEREWMPIFAAIAEINVDAYEFGWHDGEAFEAAWHD